MKKIALFIALIVILAGCRKDDEIVKYDIMIRGQESPSLRKGERHLTPQEIAKEATAIVYKVKEFGWETGKNYIAEKNRDTVNGIIIRDSWDILHPETHQLDTGFVTGKDMVLERFSGTVYEPGMIDTIGYIPNSVLQAAYNQIIAKYRSGDWQGIYDVFNQSFIFIPITGDEYQELIKQGIN